MSTARGDGAIGQLGLNRANIPGGTGSVDIPGPVEMLGLLWDRKDGRWDSGSPIGAALALETVGRG